MSRTQRTLSIIIVGLAIVLVFILIPVLLKGDFPTYSRIENIIDPLAKYFLSALGIYLSYMLGRAAIEAYKPEASWFPELVRYVCVVGFCGVFAVVLGTSLGTHQEGCDGISCDETVVDFIPTDNERVTEGLKVFGGMLIPALIGTNAGIQKLRAGRINKKEPEG